MYVYVFPAQSLALSLLTFYVVTDDKIDLNNSKEISLLWA